MDVARAIHDEANQAEFHMSLLWDAYVYRRGAAVAEFWDHLFAKRKSKLLYIVGRGFDARAVEVLRTFINSCEAGRYEFEHAELLLVGFTRYELTHELVELTESNSQELKAVFKKFGLASELVVSSVDHEGEELGPTAALYAGNEQVLARIKDHTDIVLDVSSLPRVVYLSLATAILGKLVPDKTAPDALNANGVNFQVLVAENAMLDAAIKSEDPSDDLVLIPGFGSGLRSESMSDWPMVWFPLLGENRESQFDKVVKLAGIPATTEVCPVLPHPSSNPRRADNLLLQYRQQLFDSRETPTSNILYAHESNPFEAYRQILRAMVRYQNSFSPLGGCRLAVTPLSSKLMTLAAGMACFEMKSTERKQTYAVTIPYAEPRRYSAHIDDLRSLSTSSTLSCVLLTGNAYASSAECEMD